MDSEKWSGFAQSILVIFIYLFIFIFSLFFTLGLLMVHGVMGLLCDIGPWGRPSAASVDSVRVWYDLKTYKDNFG